MRLIWAAALTAALPAWAETDFTRLSEAERAIFHAEIRAALLDVPQLLPDAPPVVIADPYAEAVESDLARIAAHRDVLFAGGAKLALIVAEGCPDCRRAETELYDISESYGVTFTRLVIGEHDNLLRDLGLEQVPAYVFEDRMFQGWMPVPVLERYLAE
ncbi:disulfide bond formation protein DsbA [Roseovarius aestuariivivens]|uniref:disulfide bond formation protein DsbA n=1 Tax=Roseovarius aestuariivivens TaxID=1888910 RepID=UPI0010807862|nr:disulfide bond formation protein DsbA [Roseovarius aestuariivivens]